MPQCWPCDSFVKGGWPHYSPWAILKNEDLCKSSAHGRASVSFCENTDCCHFSWWGEDDGDGEEEEKEAKEEKEVSREGGRGGHEENEERRGDNVESLLPAHLLTKPGTNLFLASSQNKLMLIQIPTRVVLLIPFCAMPKVDSSVWMVSRSWCLKVL